MLPKDFRDGIALQHNVTVRELLFHAISESATFYLALLKKFLKMKTNIASFLCLCLWGCYAQNYGKKLGLVTPNPKFNIIKPDEDNGAQKIQDEFSKSIQGPDTLEKLLEFLKEAKSPVSSALELRSLLLFQKEEKMILESVIEHLKADMVGIRYTKVHFL